MRLSFKGSDEKRKANLKQVYKSLQCADIWSSFWKDIKLGVTTVCVDVYCVAVYFDVPV